MKKVLLLVALVAMTITGSDLFAGGVDNNSNLSAEYIRSFTRNGFTDSADAANYNPAGLTKLKPGLSMNVSNQFIVIYDWTIYSSDAMVAMGAKEEYKSEEPVYLFPNAYFAYKQDNWAGYLAFTVPAGGGSVNFKDGLPMLAALIYGLYGPGVYVGSSAEATQMTPALTLGGAFEVNKMLSISLAARAMYTMNSYKVQVDTLAGTSKLETERTGMGFGGILGVNVDLEGVNIGIRYETETSIELENDTTKDDFGGMFFPDGEKEQHNIPAVLALGTAITVMPEMKIGVDFNYYFEHQADWNGAEEDFDNSWEIAVSAEYKVTPTLLLSLGYIYSTTAANEDTLNDLGFNLDSHSVGLGCKFMASEELDVNFGFSTTRYIESPEAKDSGNTYKKLNYIVALGVNYRIGM